MAALNLKSAKFSEKLRAPIFMLVFAMVGAALVLSGYAATNSSVCHGTQAGSPGDLCGFFVVHCPLDHTSHDDPIVFLGKAAPTHLHDFFGVKGVNYNSTPKMLLGKPTTCDNSTDSGGYWTPAGQMSGQSLNSLYQNEYWFDGGFKKTEMIPFGMELVAGSAAAHTPEPTYEAFYYCGTGTPKMDRPYTCPSSGQNIIMVVVFPQCWNGVVQTGNEAINMAYPVSPGSCPSGYPHVFPRLEEHVHLPISSPYDSHNNFVFSLSSGPYYTLHGDFINSWNQTTLNRYITNCINIHTSCGGTTPAGAASLPYPAPFPDPTPTAPPSPSPSPAPSPAPAPSPSPSPTPSPSPGPSGGSGTPSLPTSTASGTNTGINTPTTNPQMTAGLTNNNPPSTITPSPATASSTSDSSIATAAPKPQQSTLRRALEGLGWTMLAIGVPAGALITYSRIVQSRG